MKELTKAEEQVIQILWKLEKAFVKELLEEFPEPKPAYNTVSTIIRILETKGFIGHQSFGKTYQYYPLISKEDYTKFFMKNFISGYFEGSFKSMISFFAKETKVDIKEMEEIMKLMQDQVKQQKDEQ